jgi:hypothetical protein
VQRLTSCDHTVLARGTNASKSTDDLRDQGIRWKFERTPFSDWLSRYQQPQQLSESATTSIETDYSSMSTYTITLESGETFTYAARILTGSVDQSDQSLSR